MDMDESSHMPIILGRSFLATAEAEIDVQADTLSFGICEERVDFCFPPPYLPQRLPPLHPLQHLRLWLLPIFSLDSRFLMEMEDFTIGPQGMMILCQSQLVLGSLLSILWK